ncbi:hypothetical protein SLEP1_g58697 [Rubroshorea leprosula]|uniref:PGG domain-containing protein n=1 Tax=Rubroshorea leprosula TaxID=152421 RepID=A0AAV5MQJ9_9ROSI|nr:hypothetical protein SLEP1_g58697 [Rubroshorea leprosula]
MDERMREVSEAGNVNDLYELIQQNPYVLKRIDEFPFVDTPLHRAASGGHIDFAMEIVNLKPSFLRKLNPSGFSPMHLALQNDKILVASELLKVDKDLVRVKGKGGLTPLHLAVEKGNLDLVAEFLDACPECITDVTIQGQTALHIAAIFNNFDALELLIRWLQKTTHKDGDIWEEEVLNKKDRTGNTVLHLAASINHCRMVKLLVKCKTVMKNKINMNGQTPLEMLEGQDDTRETESALRQPGRCFKANTKFACRSLADSLRKESSCAEKLQKFLARQNNKISNGMRDAMLVVAALILTASFQACLSPPGGLGQGDGNMNSTMSPNSRVGLSTMLPTNFGFTFAMNTATFLTSTCMVFFLLPDEAITPLTVPLLLLILCYVNSVLLVSPFEFDSIALLIGAVGSYIFVSWPKILDLCYRRRPTFWLGTIKNVLLIILLLCVTVLPVGKIVCSIKGC